MPVTVPLSYDEYTQARRTGTLDLAMALCPRFPERCTGRGGLRLTTTLVTRPIRRLRRTILVSMVDEVDEVDDDEVDEVDDEVDDEVEVEGGEVLEEVEVLLASIALARCCACKGRFRVLPADILPRKQYSLPVIERLVRDYQKWQVSLRQAVEGLHGAGPAHTTLRGWTEGLGAYALGRPAGAVSEAAPATQLTAELEQRHPVPPPRPEPRPAEVDARRCRSEARRDRLASGKWLIALLTAMLGVSVPNALMRGSSLLRQFGVRYGLGFPTGLRVTAIERGERSRRAHSAARQEESCRDPPKSKSQRGGSN